jgi:SSS family transporter
MTLIDWIVLVGSLSFIVFYGIWKGRKNTNIKEYLLANRSMPWYTVGLSIMATQASAITFLSAPGQAYSDGMRFVQFYFGLPIAMVVLCVTLVPIYHRLNVFTAYEYLEGRFDLKTRSLAAFLFLVQRGISTGISIYAPAIILSTILGWNTSMTSVLIGVLVLVYTVTGGSKAVSHTQMGQMTVILTGMALAGILTVQFLPEQVSFLDAVRVAGKAGKLNAIDFTFDPGNEYNVWSGLIGGFFLSVSYFGTDQSQVGRYLSGSSIGQSRLGLLFNGLIKVPMQFAILFIGAMVFVFYLFTAPPIFFNNVEVAKVKASSYAAQYEALEAQQAEVFKARQEAVNGLLGAMRGGNESRIEAAQAQLNATEDQSRAIREQAVEVIRQNNPDADTNDTNYVFLTFVTDYLPAGLVGLLIAVVFSASMGSIAGAFNSLTSTTIVDVYKRNVRPDASDEHYLTMSRWITLGWGAFSIAVALFSGRVGNLLVAVNKLGSLFYGVILGIFLCAFFVQRIRGSAVFYAALIAQAIIFALFAFTDIAFLWYNLIGCLLVWAIALLFSLFDGKKQPVAAATGNNTGR